MIVTNQGKQESEFSKNFKLVGIRSWDDQKVLVKSCFSETLTKTGKIEFNTVALTRKVKLIFAKNPDILDIEEIDFKMKQM